jgi:hypothetical protein
MSKQRKVFITIDAQGWWFHFHQNYGGWFYKPSGWVLRLLAKSPWIIVVDTFGVDDGDRVRSLNTPPRKKH